MGTMAAAALIHALSLCPPQSPTSPPHRDPVVRDGAHFRIELLPGELPDELAQRLVQEALDLAESAWPVFEKAIQPKSPTKAVLRLHTHRPSFVELANRLQPEQLEDAVVVARDGSEAHVMFVPIASSALRDFGLPPALRHHLLFAAGKQLAQRQLGDRACDWVSDLIGMGLAEEVVNPRRRLGENLGYDGRRMIVVHSFLFASATELLGIIGSIKSANDKWALDMYYRRLALLAEQLAARNPAWPQRLIASWPRPSGQISTSERYAPIEALLGKDWKKTQDRFEKSYQGAKMPWEAFGDVWRRGDDWIMAGQPDRAAGVAGFKQTPAGDWTLRCLLQWEDTPERYFPQVWFDWNGKGSVRLQWKRDQIAVETWDHDKLDETIGSFPVAFTVGEPVEFRAEVRGKRLIVFVNGNQVFDQAFPARSLREAFVFAIEKSVLQVRQLGVEALKPAKK